MFFNVNNAVNRRGFVRILRFFKLLKTPTAFPDRQGVNFFSLQFNISHYTMSHLM